MRKFFPGYISHIIQLLDRYYEFTASKNSDHIIVIPVLLERIADLRREFLELQARDDLTEADQFKRNLRSFQTLLMVLEEFESFGLPVVTHYQQDFDGYLTSIQKKLCSEIGCPVAQPHVCAISTGTSGQGRDYYWYHSHFDTIFVPAAERFSILNLPDLLHELGHHILKTYPVLFLEPFPGWLSQYHENLERALVVEDTQNPDRKAESRRIFLEFWPGYWCHELICDMIAIYCVGGAYAWTNLKICQSYRPDESIYYYTDSHPPDSYRMDAILAMLKHLGINSKDIRKTWTEYAEIFRHNKPPLYDNYFPLKLTEKMAQHIFNICDDIGLLPCTENLQKETTIISKLNQAWDLFLKNPKRFQKMERNLGDRSVPFVQEDEK